MLVEIGKDVSLEEALKVAERELEESQLKKKTVDELKKKLDQDAKCRDRS